MNTKIDPKDIADEFFSSISYMRTLLGAAEDKMQFYLSNSALLGPYRELLARQADETDALLTLMERLLERMEGNMELVGNLLYAIEPSGISA